MVLADCDSISCLASLLVFQKSLLLMSLVARENPPASHSRLDQENRAGSVLLSLALKDEDYQGKPVPFNLQANGAEAQ